MNLSEALDAALPEIRRSQLRGDTAPRMDPELLMREDTIDGELMNVAYQRSTGSVYRFPPLQWRLVSAFDGKRNYEEVAEAFTGETGFPLSAEEAKTFAANMDEGGFWYKTSEEKNLRMNEKLMAQRGRKSRGGTINLAHISFSAWDPDRYLSALDRSVGRYVYSSWFTWLTVLLFCFEAVIFATKWNVLGPDIPLYYNFSKKGFADIAEFWLLFLALGFFHESAHGLTCKHFGGEVHSMGLMLLYLAPAFYVDVTEVYISATRLQRLATIIAGIWVEMMICGIAMVVWTNTHPGDPMHDFAYKLILITGLAVIVLNLNPLMKLDGYYFFAEWLRIPDLKERSTEFLSGIFQHHVLRLPVEVPIVPRRRVALFAAYAAMSGAYSYMMLYFVVRLSYNIFSHWFDKLAVFPAAFFAYLIFRGRLRVLRATIAKFFHARAEDGSLRLTPAKTGIVLLAAVLFFAPLWHDREDAFYLVEPVQQQTLRASVAGRVSGVTVKEGDPVSAGQVLATVESVNAKAHGASAREQVLEARNLVYAAETKHRDLGAALTAQEAARRLNSAAEQEQSTTNITAPFDGIVVTGNTRDLLGRDVGAGDSLIEIEQMQDLAVRIFVPASEMSHVHLGDDISFEPPGNFRSIHARLDSLESSPVVLPQGIVSSVQYKGIELPSFYSARLLLNGSLDGLRPGMTGKAKVFDKRRSVADRAVDTVLGFLHSLFW